ncbi:MAG: BrnT family toxin [Betaproteobacteria bacterium]|nr:BrnT family toxin [Betaproteobacteria bacterium]
MVTYDETKRQANPAKHGIDLAECSGVFDAPMLTEEDAREAYGEQRLKSLCWVRARVAVLVWTDRETGPHLISCRYGDKHETQTYFNTFL